MLSLSCIFLTIKANPLGPAEGLNGPEGPKGPGGAFHDDPCTMLHRNFECEECYVRDCEA